MMSDTQGLCYHSSTIDVIWNQKVLLPFSNNLHSICADNSRSLAAVRPLPNICILT